SQSNTTECRRNDRHDRLPRRPAARVSQDARRSNQDRAPDLPDRSIRGVGGRIPAGVTGAIRRRKDRWLRHDRLLGPARYRRRARRPVCQDCHFNVGRTHMNEDCDYDDLPEETKNEIREAVMQHLEQLINGGLVMKTIERGQTYYKAVRHGTLEELAIHRKSK